MSIDITSWLRAFFALQAQASESRGFVELRDDEHSVQRWPRTSGDDVVAIAAVLDPVVRTEPERLGSHAIVRRWDDAIDTLEESALVAPRSEFVQNRDFWETIAALCVHLHAEDVPLPDQTTWGALLGLLAEPVALRNVGPTQDGPFAHFPSVKTFDDLYIAQYTFLRDKRGADTMPPPPADTGNSIAIPRTTNADVLQLATYWTHALTSVKQVMGHEGVAKRWQAVLADVDALAKPGKPEAVYAKNNAFWRELKRVAVQVALSDEAPTTWSMVLDSIGTSITHLPENLADGAKKVANTVAEAAGAVVHEAGRGFLGALKVPLLLGAAGLAGIYFLTRNRHERAES